MSDKPRLLTPVEAAYRLHVSRRTVYEWIASGRLEGVKFDRSYRIEPAAIDRCIAKHRVQPPAPKQQEPVKRAKVHDRRLYSAASRRYVQ